MYVPLFSVQGRDPGGRTLVHLAQEGGVGQVRAQPGPGHRQPGEDPEQAQRETDKREAED